MNETALIIGDIIIGIAVLGVLSAVITDIMVRRLSPAPPAMTILQQRYAQGEWRDQDRSKTLPMPPEPMRCVMPLVPHCVHGYPAYAPSRS